MKINFIGVFLAILLASGCNQTSETKTEKKDGDWLSGGSVDERFTKVSKQLRGFDMAMVEVGYRYVELFWAGREQNWDYAAYLVDKIEVAIRNGIERRPKRGPSAQMIFPTLEELESAISQKSIQKFNQGYGRLTITCNACHSAEKVSFVHVEPPKHRLSPIVWKSPPQKKVGK